MHPKIHKVIITGTGRAGTTFLVRLLTELGLDTGFSRHNWRTAYHGHCHAGLEQDLMSPQAPYIVKNPGLCRTLPEALATGLLTIDHAIIPVRNLELAAMSRIAVGGSDGSVPGGLWGTADPSAQRWVLAELFHTLIQTLVAHDIPHTFLLFPRLVEDADYTYGKLRFLLGDIGLAEFKAAFARVAEPSLVHRHFAGPPADAGDTGETPAAAAYRRALRQRRVRRWVRRTGRGLAAAACALALAMVGWKPMTPNREASVAALGEDATAAVASTPLDQTHFHRHGRRIDPILRATTGTPMLRVGRFQTNALSYASRPVSLAAFGGGAAGRRGLLDPFQAMEVSAGRVFLP